MYFQEDCRDKLRNHLLRSQNHFHVAEADSVTLAMHTDIETADCFWDPAWDKDSGKLLAGVRVGVGGGLIGGCVVRMGVGNGDEGEGGGGKGDEGEGR